MKILTRGTRVRIDPVCEETRKAYGVNDNMRRDFLGKVALVATDTFIDSFLVKLQIEGKGSSWSFHRADVKEYSFDDLKDVKKPEVKTVVFNPEYL